MVKKHAESQGEHTKQGEKATLAGVCDYLESHHSPQ
jgi:hypothetical protein